MTADTSDSEQSHNPRTGESVVGPACTSPAQVEQAISNAVEAAHPVGVLSPRRRAGWLNAIADGLEDSAEELIELADLETALGVPRLRGELGRAAAQARFYGEVATEGSWLGVCIDQTESPLKVDLRRANLPLGPIAVFGASNFPFMFGVAGHDTASALAAGCPVLAKAHPAHPRLSVLLADIVKRSLESAGAPRGAFELVVGFESGLGIVDGDGVQAVAFTGSQNGGMALADRAERRNRPIPVFAEMGTINPVVLTTAGAAARMTEVAEGFLTSFTLGQGQFCTKPGLLLAPAGSGAADAVAKALPQAPLGWMLTESIARTYESRIEELLAAGARIVAVAAQPGAGYAVAPTVVTASADDLQPGSPLLQECFGPVAIVVEYADPAELDSILGRLQPSLAASVASSGRDDPDVAALVTKLAGQVGRVVVDGWPTGVATEWAQHHGGPWPATSRPDASSVGASALDRFTRTVAFQDVPGHSLPAALQDQNAWDVPRRLNGVMETPAPPSGPR